MAHLLGLRHAIIVIVIITIINILIIVMMTMTMMAWRKPSRCAIAPAPGIYRYYQY